MASEKLTIEHDIELAPRQATPEEIEEILVQWPAEGVEIKDQPGVKVFVGRPPAKN